MARSLEQGEEFLTQFRKRTEHATVDNLLESTARCLSASFRYEDPESTGYNKPAVFERAWDAMPVSKSTKNEFGEYNRLLGQNNSL